MLHWIDSGIDTGAAIVEQAFEWPKTAYPIDIMAAQKSSLPELAAGFRAAISTDLVNSKAQSNARPYFPALNTETDGKIDWHWNRSEIERCVRAFGWPYAGSGTTLILPDRQTKRKIHIARAKVGASGWVHPLACGVVLAHTKDGAAEIACKDGSVLVESIRDGIHELPAGNTIRVGSRLTS